MTTDYIKRLNEQLEHKLSELDAEKKKAEQRHKTALRMLPGLAEKSGLPVETLFRAASLATNIYQDMSALDLLFLLDDFYGFVKEIEMNKK